MALGSGDSCAQGISGDTVWLANIAALRLATSTTLPDTFCQLLGYSTNGDGGQGLFVVGANAADNNGTIINDASGRSWYRAGYGNWRSVKWFGATGNGTTDDTVAIQNAINVGAGTVYFPAGHYVTSATLVVSTTGTQIVGESKGAAQISPTASVDVFHFSNVGLCGFASMSVSFAGAPTAGAVLNVDTCGFFRCEDFYFYNCYYGVYVNGVNAPCYIQTFDIDTVSHIGIYWNQPTPGTSNGGLIFIESGTISCPSSNAATGIALFGGDTCRMTNVDILRLGTGVNISPPSGNVVQWVFGESVAADTCYSNGWVINPSSGGIAQGIQLVNCWGSSCAATGFEVRGGYNIQFTACRAFNNALAGWQFVGSVAHFSMDACVASGNGTTSANVPGIYVGPGIGNFSIRNCTAAQVQGFGNTQNFGIIVDSGTGGNYMIVNNYTHGNVVSGVSDYGTGPNRLVGSNLT
ncbi:hypothetical protein ISN73_12365 [Dyella acidisoli]